MRAKKLLIFGHRTTSSEASETATYCRKEGDHCRVKLADDTD